MFRKNDNPHQYAFTHGFEDGEAYDIDISNNLGVKEWIEGGMDEILWARELGVDVRVFVRREMMRFGVRDEERGMGKMEVKRDGTDGRLSWLWCREEKKKEVAPEDLKLWIERGMLRVRRGMKGWGNEETES